MTPFRFRPVPALAVILGLVLVLAGCADSGKGRLRDVAVNIPQPTLTPSKQDVPKPLPDPETYGLPPLATLQANPGGVAGGLLQRMNQTTWTEKWAVELKGADIGDVVLEHLPPDPRTGGGQHLLHIAGTLGTGDGKNLQFEVLDKGDGKPQACMTGAGATDAWVCDVKEFKVAVQFLSADGLQTLGNLFRQLLGFPGLSVQYYLIGGAPSACFFFPPAPNLAADGQKLGVDVSKGGSYCLSREGAIDRLDFGDLKISAVEYSTTANPAKFKLPV